MSQVGLTRRGQPTYPPNGGANAWRLRSENQSAQAFAFLKQPARRGKVSADHGGIGPTGLHRVGLTRRGQPTYPPNGGANAWRLHSENQSAQAFAFLKQLARRGKVSADHGGIGPTRDPPYPGVTEQRESTVRSD